VNQTKFNGAKTPEGEAGNEMAKDEYQIVLSASDGQNHKINCDFLVPRLTIRVHD
jgi:hypothetical protein